MINKPKSKAQQKADKAFIEKLKTLTVGTGSKATPPKCPDCGGDMVQLKLKGVGVVIRHIGKQRPQPAFGKN